MKKNESWHSLCRDDRLQHLGSIIYIFVTTANTEVILTIDIELSPAWVVGENAETLILLDRTICRYRLNASFYTCEDQRPWETIFLCTAWSVSRISLCWSLEICSWKGMARTKYWLLLRWSTGWGLDQGLLWERWADWEDGRVIGLVARGWEVGHDFHLQAGF